ncbi:MAG: hypothetical protein FD144_3133 [Rhodospirillaceae bacterium]|nr:MAG: hypothetical protein FD144_3133 [Rhodospirillaceae bacterium]
MIRRLALALLFVASTAHGQPPDLEAIGRQPGTEIIRQGDTVEIRRGGVTVIVDKNGGELGIDRSRPAVLCYWSIAVAVKISADLCYPGEFAELSRTLGEQIAAMNDFIVVNSLRPVTKDSLEKSIADRFTETAARMKAVGVPPAQYCQREREAFLVPWNADLSKFRQSFQGVLAVPRPPASNPCL